MTKFELVTLAEEKQYGRFHVDWWKNNEVSSDSWYLELCLLQKWLREDHKINIWMQDWDKLGYGFDVTSTQGDVMFASTKPFKTYEEALEKALYESLKFIENDDKTK